MTDASFQAAGYAVLIEDDPNQKYTSTRKTYAPIAYGSKTYPPPSDPLDEIGFARPSLDHLYNSHLFRASERIWPRVFKLSVSLNSFTSVREKPKTASACRLEHGCCERLPTKRSLSNDSVMVGRE